MTWNGIVDVYVRFNWPDGYHTMPNGFSSLQPAAVSMG